MTKFCEITDAAERAHKINLTSERWVYWREMRLQTLNRITSYLFILNTGALLAALTYVASKPANTYIQCSIWFFSVGILCSVAHAAIDYYVTENEFVKFSENVQELYANNLDWAEFDRLNRQPYKYETVLHLLGWVGGGVFFIGLVMGSLQIR